MTENKNIVETHGCIVCGKLYDLLVIYAPDGSLVGCAPKNPDAHRVMDTERPLVACNRHTSTQIEEALSKHYPGKEQEDEVD